MNSFVFLVLWHNSTDGMQVTVCDSMETAYAVCAKLREQNRDPWISTQAVRGIEYAALIG